MNTLLVTGAARGIGAAVAALAAARGYRVVVAMFEEIDGRYGRLAGLVNNAGVTGGGARIEDLAAATLERVLAVNVMGSMLCAREAVRRMSTARGGAGGAIVNISSIASRIGGGGEWVHYAVSKGAIDTFTRGLAREVAHEGIRVNAVAPGLVATDIHATSPIPHRLERMTESVPMRRPGTPEEVAEVVLFLLSPAAGYVTGAIVPVGGGR